MDRAQTLDAVQRASARSARDVHGEMQRGLSTLASIATTAPLIGVLCTVHGIATSFPGYDGPKLFGMALIMGNLSESLLPTAVGLLAAVIAFSGHRYFMARLEDFDSEMESATLHLMNQLRVRNRPRSRHVYVRVHS